MHLEFRDTFLLPTSTFVNGILTVIVSAVMGGQQNILSGHLILRILIRPNTHSHTSSPNMYGLEQIMGSLCRLSAPFGDLNLFRVCTHKCLTWKNHKLRLQHSDWDFAFLNNGWGRRGKSELKTSIIPAILFRAEIAYFTFNVKLYLSFLRYRSYCSQFISSYYNKTHTKKTRFSHLLRCVSHTDIVQGR